MRARLLQAVVIVAGVCLGTASCDGKESPTEPTPVCSIAISPASLTFGPDGGTGNVTVTAPAACAWSAASSGGWIAVTAGGSGSGPGTVAYAVAVHSSVEPRSGTLTIGGQSHAVTQQGRPATVCSYDLSPGSAEFGKDAGTGTFAVSAPGDCTWAATSSASWLVITSGNQGSGSSSVSYAVARNVDIADRSASITVADRMFAVRQAGDIGGCQYSVAPVDLRPCMPGGSLTVVMTTQASCPWTVTPNASWLSIPSGSSGTGSSVITITFSDNYDAPREGVAMVRWPTPTAGQNIRVAQAGCLYAVSRTAFSFASSGGSGTFDVIQQSEPNTCGGATQDRCVWTALSDVSWITITSSMPRSGDNPVSFTVATNDSAASRVGRITVRDKVVVVTQTGR
jgi:Viral BACON domain/Putative binding domain, N-terminal